MRLPICILHLYYASVLSGLFFFNLTKQKCYEIGKSVSTQFLRITNSSYSRVYE